MAFTGVEFLRGGVWAIGIFVVALPWVIQLVPSMLMEGSADGFVAGLLFVLYFMTIAGAITGFVYITYGSALAFLLGLALRSTRRRSLHRVCFAALGVLVGYVTLVLTDLAGLTYLSGSVGTGSIDGTSVAICVTAGASVLAGWEITSSRALRADARSVSSV